MTRNLLSLILLTTLAAGVSLNAEPTPIPDHLRTNAKRVNNPERTTSLAEGWSHVKGEWIHSDGYKYVKGKVVSLGSHPKKMAPKPPSKALLDSIKVRPTPSPAPNSAAAKAAEKERNMRQRPAPQTGTHL